MFSQKKQIETSQRDEKKKPVALVIAINSDHIAALSNQLHGYDCHAYVIANLDAEKLHSLYQQYKADFVVIDGRSIKEHPDICFEFNTKYCDKDSRPYFYIDVSHTPTILTDYCESQKSCATVSYSDGGKAVHYYGRFRAGSDEKFKSDNNMNIASVGKLFTVLACYFALQGRMNGLVNVHPDIELPPYVREKIKRGITANQLLFHQAGLGNYLINLLELVKEKKIIPPVTDTTSLAQLAPVILEPELNMDLQNQTYSNTGYFVLGLAIETAINLGREPSDPKWKSFYQYVKEQILADRMPNTTHIQSEKMVISPTLNKELQDQQLPTTSAGCWYSTAEDIYHMMEWVNERCKTDVGLRQFIIDYNTNHPLHKNADPNIFMHEGHLDTGTDAFASLNLATSEIFCLVTNEMDWSLSGLQHLVTRQTLSDISLEVAQKLDEENDNKRTLTH